MFYCLQTLTVFMRWKEIPAFTGHSGWRHAWGLIHNQSFINHNSLHESVWMKLKGVSEMQVVSHWFTSLSSLHLYPAMSIYSTMTFDFCPHCSGGTADFLQLSAGGQACPIMHCSTAKCLACSGLAGCLDRFLKLEAETGSPKLWAIH